MELVLRLFHHIRSPACSTTVTFRSAALASLFLVASQLCKQDPENRAHVTKLLRDLPYHFVCFRIGESSKGGTSPYEHDLRAAFSIPGFVNTRVEDADTVLELLRHHPWAAEVDELLVRRMYSFGWCKVHIYPGHSGVVPQPVYSSFIDTLLRVDCQQGYSPLRGPC